MPGSPEGALDTIRHIDRLDDEAQDALERFRDGGKDEDLDAWAERIGRLGDDPLTSKLVFASLGHGSYEAEPDLMDRLRKRETEFQYKSLPVREGGDGAETTS